MGRLDVLLVTGYVPPMPCGVGHYTVRLRSALEEEGVRADVASVLGARDLAELRRRVREDGPAVVHLMYPARGYARSLAPLLIPRAVRPARLLLGVHEYSSAHPVRRLMVRALARRAWRVVVSTPLDREGLKRHDPFIVPIPANVIADPESVPAAPAPRARPDPIEIVFFGFVNRRKGVDTLIEACALLAQRRRRAVVHVVGQVTAEFAAYREKMAELARARNVTVNFAGELPDGQVVEALQRADLCALPFAEGASARHATLVTALQAGVPVITTEGPDVPLGLGHGRQAWMVPPRDAGALSEAIAHLADDAELRARLGREGRSFAGAFSWRAVAREFARVYGDLRR